MRTKSEINAIKELKENGEIKVQLGGKAVVVRACSLTGLEIENRSNRVSGFVLGLIEGRKGNQAYAYAVRIGHTTCNASRGAFVLVG